MSKRETQGDGKREKPSQEEIKARLAASAAKAEETKAANGAAQDDPRMIALDERCAKIALIADEAAREIQISDAFEEFRGFKIGRSVIRNKVEELRRARNKKPRLPKPKERTAPKDGAMTALEVPDDTALEQALVQLNARHDFVMEGGKATILRSNISQISGLRIHDRISTADFEKAYGNRRYVVGGRNVRAVSIGRLWLEWERRSQYLGGVVFDPANRHGKECKNLWEGFAYVPKKGSWRLLRQHLFKILCGGNRASYRYLRRWMAKLVQHPDKQGEVAIVVRGIEGCGKGIVGRALKALFGHHGRQVSNPAHLVGRFNEHLQCCVFLFADEAFYAGDVQHTSVLKSLITEPTLDIEGKYKTAVEARNYLHIFMASNLDWVVPAGLEARRFCVLDALGDVAGDRAYFDLIQAELDAGGYEAMLYDLLHVNLTSFDVTKVPDTAGLQDQKMRSLKTEQRWWLDVLQRGYVYKSKLGLDDEINVWHADVATDLLVTAYEEYAKAKGERHPLNRVHLGRFLNEVGASARRYQGKNGVLAGEKTLNGFARAHYQKMGVGSGNKGGVHGYHLGTLEASRADFEHATKLNIEWSGDDDGIEIVTEEVAPPPPAGYGDPKEEHVATMERGRMAGITN